MVRIVERRVGFCYFHYMRFGRKKSINFPKKFEILAALSDVGSLSSSAADASIQKSFGQLLKCFQIFSNKAVSGSAHSIPALGLKIKICLGHWNKNICINSH